MIRRRKVIKQYKGRKVAFNKIKANEHEHVYTCLSWSIRHQLLTDEATVYDRQNKLHTFGSLTAACQYVIKTTFKS